MSETNRVSVLIASYLEPEHVARIRAVDPRLHVTYEPDLLSRPRYAADHTAPLVRSSEDEARWRSLLGRADVLFDFDYTNLEGLPDLAPRVRWIQATSAGIGQLVKRHDYAGRMPGVLFATASGVHARPLAEFCLLAFLATSRGLFTMAGAQRRHHWERFAGSDLLGQTVVIFGHGSIGTEVARLARAFGMKAIGLRRTRAGEDPAQHQVDELLVPSALHAVLPRARFLVLAAPHTAETEGVIGPKELALLPRGAVLVNVSRGALVDEDALLEALRSGHLGGAFLDVFREEPLPARSPLWDLPNVLVSPHSASTSDRENALLTDLFCDNLRRFLDGQPLRNVLDPTRHY
jgi:phosphoglycerate dehydrogenase-like enzyme